MDISNFFQKISTLKRLKTFNWSHILADMRQFLKSLQEPAPTFRLTANFQLLGLSLAATTTCEFDPSSDI